MENKNKKRQRMSKGRGFNAINLLQLFYTGKEIFTQVPSPFFVSM